MNTINRTISRNKNLIKNQIALFMIFCLLQPLHSAAQTQKVWHLQMEPFLDEEWVSSLDEVDMRANENFIHTYRGLVTKKFKVDYWLGNGQALVNNPFDFTMLFDKKENACFLLDSIHKATYPIALSSWQVSKKEKDKIHIAGNNSFFNNSLLLKNNLIQLLPETKTIAGVVCKKAGFVFNPPGDENTDLQIIIWYSEAIPGFGLYENIFTDVFPGAVMEFIVEGGYGLRVTKAQQVSVTKNFFDFPYGYIIFNNKFDYDDYTQNHEKPQIKTPLYPLQLATPALSMSAEKLRNDSIWTVFADEENELFGFKDIYGKIKIAPKFSGFISAYRFDKIIGAMEINGDKSKQYILLKNGKQISNYAPYIFDHYFDCESEGHLRITDPKTDKVGMINAEGEVSVTPEFDYLTKMDNDLYAALSDAKKDILDDNVFWKGGHWNLYNKQNQLLVKNITKSEYLDFHSLKITDAPLDAPGIRSYKGVNGKYYNFTDTKQEFKNFLERQFTTGNYKQGIKDILFHTILIGKAGERELFLSANQFAKDYTGVFEKLNEVVRQKDSYFDVRHEPFVRFINEGFDNHFGPYRDNCRDFTKSQHPLFSVSFRLKNAPVHTTERLYFLRTDKSFRLIWAELSDE